MRLFLFRQPTFLSACGAILLLLAAARLALSADETGAADAVVEENASELPAARSGNGSGPSLPKLEVDEPMPRETSPPQPARGNGSSSIRTAPIPRKPESAAQLLEFFDIDESLLRQLIDGRPLHADEKEAIVRVLFALPKLPAEFLQKWTEPSPDWDAIIESPQDYRMNIYQLQGHVTRVEKIPLIPEAAERFDFAHYYQATVELGEDRWEATVCARRIPLKWKIGEPINEAVSFRGLLLKMSEGPVFATTRIAWHPNRLEEAEGITRSQVILGDLGMDVGLWDDVRDRRPLLSGDRECFYQLMHAMGRIKQERMRELTTATFDFADTIRHPRDYHGRLLRLEGIARKCSKIIVSDPDIRARFGIDHYYEIYLIVDLEKKIVYKDEATDKTVEFQTFPIAICARQLPPGMPEGDNIYEAVSISGVFFKLWEYDSRKMAAFNPNQEQPCPMLFALQPDLIQQETYNPYVGPTIGGLFVVALLGVWIGIWRFGREDAQFARSTLKRQFELSQGESLNELGIESAGGPDFSHLTAAATAVEAATPPREEKSVTLSAAVRQHVTQLISQRIDPEEIRAYLKDHGFDDAQFDAVYDELGFTARELRMRHRQAQHNRRIGGILVFVGTVLGVAAMFVETLGGGGIIISVGLLGYGLIMMMTGDNYLASFLFQRQSFAKSATPNRQTERNR